MLPLVRLIRKTYQMAQPRERRVVMRNVAYLSVLQIITFLLPIIIIPYLFRALGADKFGLLAFAQAFVQYFMMLTDYGFNLSATKEISLCRNNRARISEIFSSIMMVKALFVLASALILGAVVYFVPKFRQDWLVYVLSFGMVVGNALFPVWLFQGTEKMKYIARLNIIGGMLFPLLIFPLVRTPHDYLLVPVINSIVYLVPGLLSLIVAVLKLNVSFTLRGAKDVRHQLAEGWNIFISVVAINAYTTTRIFLIGLLTNNTITGFYSIAERVANVCQTFPLNSFTQAIFPRISAIFHRSRNKALILMQHMQQITIRVALICLPVIAFFAEPVMTLVCGREYPEAVLSFRLLLAAVFCVSANAFRVQFLLVCGRTELYSRIHVTMAAIALPLLFVLTYFYSYIGAAAATISIEASICTVTFIMVRRLTFPNNHRS